MKELLEKIGAYNIFNFLLPGVVFAVLVNHLTAYSLVQGDLVIDAFLYYFLGLAISRFGSLVIEPILKMTSFVQFAPYADFVSASGKDPKLEILFQENNMYRTLIAMFVLLVFAKGFELISTRYPSLHGWEMTIVCVLLFLGFLLAYRKQNVFIKKRIEIFKS